MAKLYLNFLEESKKIDSLQILDKNLLSHFVKNELNAFLRSRSSCSVFALKQQRVITRHALKLASDHLDALDAEL